MNLFFVWRIFSQALKSKSLLCSIVSHDSALLQFISIKKIKDHHFETSIKAKSNPSLSKRFQFCINLLLIGACKNLCKFTHICVGWFVNWIWCQFQLEKAYFAVNWEVVCKWISFFGNVDEFFSLKRWAADGFQIVDSVQKTFPRRTNRRKKCQSHSNSRKREKFSCIFKTYKLFFGKQHFTKALWYYFISEIMKLGTQLAPTCMCVPLR